LRVLVACEFSGVVSKAFRDRGHVAISCDLLPTTGDPRWHYKSDVLEIINREYWDLMIAHPPCTYLTVSGLHWNKNNPERAQKTEEALEFVERLMNANIPKIAIENPVGCISSRIRKPDQIIQPYEFGEDASKRTCLWLKGLEPLKIDPDKRFGGRWVEGVDGRKTERWSNQTDSGQNRLGPSEDRWKLRSVTYQGVAYAFAAQWG
jgi:hypothetical protein